MTTLRNRTPKDAVPYKLYLVYTQKPPSKGESFLALVINGFLLIILRLYTTGQHKSTHFLMCVSAFGKNKLECLMMGTSTTFDGEKTMVR